MYIRDIYRREKKMSKCVVCGKETNVTCICGYCPDCIAWKGHEGCNQIIREREIEKKMEIKNG
jgi:NMD protein affecting ribosome stability and mRNA decay